jgi:hypothetical protein
LWDGTDGEKEASSGGTSCILSSNSLIFLLPVILDLVTAKF